MTDLLYVDAFRLGARHDPPNRESLDFVPRWHENNASASAFSCIDNNIVHNHETSPVSHEIPTRRYIVPMSNIDILITGGCGFVGRAIVTALTAQQPTWRVTVVDLQELVDKETSDPRIRYIKVDVTSIADVQEAFQELKPTIVIHCAGVVPPLAQRYTRVFERVVKNVNINGTRNVLKAAIESGVSAFIYTSSCCAVIDDLTGYYASQEPSLGLALHSRR